MQVNCERKQIIDKGHAGGIGISARATALLIYRSLSSVAVISLSAYFPVGRLADFVFRITAPIIPSVVIVGVNLPSFTITVFCVGDRCDPTAFFFVILIRRLVVIILILIIHMATSAFISNRLS